jgi:hypothetical protein
MEVSLRALPPAEPPHGRFGVALRGDSGPLAALTLADEPDHALISVWEGAALEGERILLPEGFRADAFHLLRLEVDGERVRLSLDGRAVAWSGRIAGRVRDVALFAEGTGAEFAGFEVTAGWEDAFTDGCAGEWTRAGGVGEWVIEAGELRQVRLDAEHSLIAREALAGDFDLVVNARAVEASEAQAAHGFRPAMTDGDAGPLVKVEAGGREPRITWPDGVFALPSSFSAGAYQHFRCLRRGRALVVRWQTENLCEIAVPAGPVRVGLYAHRTAAAFDLVRITAADR